MSKETETIKTMGKYSLSIKKPGEIVIDFASGNNVRIVDGEVTTGRRKSTDEMIFYMTQSTYDSMHSAIMRNVSEFREKMEKQRKTEAGDAPQA